MEIALLILLAIVFLLIGMSIGEYRICKKMEKECDDSYLVGYIKGKEETETCFSEQLDEIINMLTRMEGK